MEKKNKRNFIPTRVHLFKLSLSKNLLLSIRLRLKIAILCTVLGLSSFVDSDASEFRKIEDNHFVIYYEDAPYSLIQTLLLKLNYYSDKIKEDLGFPFPQDKIKLYIYRDHQEYLSLGNQTSSTATTSLKERKIQTYFGPSGFLDTVLPHELTHIFFREFIGLETKGIPLCLEEGLACLGEKQRRVAYQYILQKLAEENKIFSLAELFSITDLSLLEENRQEIFYTQSLGLVDYLLNKFGKDKFLIFLQALKDKGLTSALENIYGFKTTEELEGVWRVYLRIK